MTKRILNFIIDVILLAVGSLAFVSSVLNDQESEAGIGAAMIVIGLLIREWRNEPQRSILVEQEKPQNSEDEIKRNGRDEIKRKARLFNESQSKTMIIVLLAVSAFTFWGFNNSRINNHDHNEFRVLDYKIDEVENYTNSLESRVKEIEENSHSHRGY